LSLLPITLGVRRPSDTEKGARSPSKPQSEKTLRRDDYTCRFCGFRAQHYQRVIPYASADADLPFVTACTFCEQCMLLERAGMMGSGVLIWLPEIPQAELNHIARAVYVGRASGGTNIATLADRTLDALMARRGDAKKRLGSDDPLLLATVMHETLTDEESRKATPKLDGVRLLALDKHLVRGQKGDINQFPRIVKYWCSSEGPYANFPAEKWTEMFKTASASVGHA
jgi:intracellular multiplication protein IcmJ